MQSDSEKHACLESGTTKVTIVEPCECEQPIEPTDFTVEFDAQCEALAQEAIAAGATQMWIPEIPK